MTKKKAQNIIEFLFIAPLLIIISLIIFEVAYFWQEANAIYNLNEEINANVADLNYRNLNLNDQCPAVPVAEQILESKDAMISASKPSYNLSVVDGQEPFSLYRYASNNNVTTNDGVKPQISLWIDCRNPFEDGIITQVEFYHKTVVMKATIPRFDKPEGIVIIPENISVASPKLNTLMHY